MDAVLSLTLVPVVGASAHKSRILSLPSTSQNYLAS